MPRYLTAVPITDNEHVAAGQVIARIDDRDYRNALAEAQAQVAAARANIENIDAQIVPFQWSGLGFEHRNEFRDKRSIRAVGA